MPTTLEFLQAILPPTGQYCAVTIVNGHAKQHFFSTIENLAEGVRLADKQLEGTNGAIYHGCSSYSGASRSQQSVELIKSFWLDIDTGDGKPYSDLETAISRLRDFVVHYSLPDPILVCSGTGLHVYWRLEEAVTRETWQPIAQALKDACHTFGLGAGPERTADAASILRPPGSTHRKGNPRPVVCGPLSPPVKLEVFNGLLAGRSNSAPSAVHTTLIRNGRVYRSKSTLLADCSNIYAPEAIDFEKLTEQCGQFRTFRDTAGNISEPLWYALLGVLGFTYDGAKKAHEWSSGHPKYSFQETEGRLKRVKELSGPTTCAHIKGINPSGCVGCAFGSSTPLDAGRRTYSDSISEQSIPASSEASMVETSLPQFAVEGYSQWQYKDGGLYWCHEDITKKAVEVKLSSFPVRISSVHVGEINHDQYYYHFQHYKPHGGWKDLIVRPSHVHGQSMVSAMADLGIVVHDPVKFNLYIKDSVDSINKKHDAEMSYEQFGWKGDKFLYGDQLYDADGAETAAISPELRLRSQWLRPARGGSLAGWKQAVDNLMGRGSEGMSFTVLASFASVLMPFFEANEGGAVINLMTRHSGAGKTTALSGAMTVWATDPRALELISIDTKVSQGVSLGALCNLPCIYDEFDNKDPEKVREFMVMFTSGRDKLRGNSDATLIHTASSWRMMLLTASNASIADTISSLGRSDAPAMRVLELPVESSGTMKPSELVELSKQLYANAGHAGEAFVRYLVQPDVTDWVREKLRELLDEIYEKCGFQKEHRFWARALAAIGCAALIVEELGLISFSTDRIMKWALDHFSQGAKERVAEPRSMLEHLAAYLNESIGSTLTMPGPSEGRKLFAIVGEKPKSRIHVRIELKGSTCYVEEAPLRKWLEQNAGGGYAELVRDLRRYHMLIGDRVAKTLSAGTEIESGQVRCMVFDIGHPKFSGVIREVEKTVGHPINLRRA